MKKTYLYLLLIAVAIASCRNGRQQYYDPAVMQISQELSNQNITAFAEDSLGYIWMGTERGLNRYNRSEYHQYFHSDDDTTSLPSSNISALYTDRSGRLWVGTIHGVCYYTKEGGFRRVTMNDTSPQVHQIWEEPDGTIYFNTILQLARYVPATNSAEIVNYHFDPSHDYINECFTDSHGRLYSVTTNSVRCFGQDKQQPIYTLQTGLKPHYSYLCRNGLLWVAEGQKVHVYDVNTRKEVGIPKAIQEKGILNNATLTLLYDTPNYLYIGTSRALYAYSHQLHKVARQDEYGFPFSDVQGNIRHMFLDKTRNLWIALQMKGYEVRHNFKERFNGNPYLTSQLKGHSITSMCVDHQGLLWILDADNHCWTYDSTNGHLQTIETEGTLGPRLPNEALASLFADSQGRVWVINNERLYQAAISGGRLVLNGRYANIPKVVSIAEDLSHNLWIGIAGEGIYCLPQGSTTMVKRKVGKGGFRYTYSICPIDRSRLLLGLGLSNPIIFNTQNGSARQLGLWKNSNELILTSSMRHVGNGMIAIATRFNGVYLYNIKTEAIVRVTDMTCDDALDIIPAGDGTFWVSTLNGLSQVNVKTHKAYNYSAADGIGGNQFNEHASARLSEGKIVFGGTHGITLFSASNNATKHRFPLYFEDVTINNKPLKAGRSTAFDSLLALRPKVDLAHNQNSFGVSFSALDYRMHEQIHYSYRLEGSGNGNWTDLRNGSELWFNNLRPGHYRLHVRTNDSEHAADQNEAVMDITIHPAPWNTWWAWLLYLIIIGYVLSIFYRGRMRIIDEKRRAERMQLEKEQEERVNRMNMSYFANISHEFRTPLTMIAGGAKMLDEQTELSGKSRQLLGTIRWNTQRMLCLIAQMLDFHKLENDALPLQVAQIDVAEELNHVLDSVVPSMSEKHITLERKGMDERFEAWADPDKLEKVVSNLLSNALKFTPEGGRVTCALASMSADEGRRLFPEMEATATKEYAVVTVDDNGQAIPEDKLEKIFLKYYQVENHHNYGTGIGLYYCRRLMQLHHGGIKAENLAEGGVRFTMVFPMDDVYSAQEHAPEEVRSNAIDSAVVPTNVEEDTEAKPDDSKPRLVVVDDDPSVVNYLRMVLTPHYTVFHAFNAETALALIREKMPDLVLSDVMMPGTDGMALCRSIKADDDICHIPVILVTAKVTPKDQIDGLHTGAEAYVTKPFDPEYLLALIASLLAGRERIKRQLGAVTKTEELGENTLSPRDTAFMDDLYALMEKELTNPELNVNTLAEKLGLSRSKFYYKMKALTGEKPLDFFKKYKLNRAAELLLEGHYNVSEVAYKTGFSSLTVFSRSFKQHFGVAPSEYHK